tara:strand:- start:296 stop:523 length:228 start_codon:yes stop_codon:yes gene_type:complete
MTNYDKVQTIVTKKIVKEKIKFRGKTIIREKLELEWDIPKIINSDIGYQLMFGNKPAVAKLKQDSGIEEIILNNQ